MTDWNWTDWKSRDWTVAKAIIVFKNEGGGHFAKGERWKKWKEERGKERENKTFLIAALTNVVQELLLTVIVVRTGGARADDGR